MLANTVANLTNVLRMKREYDTWVTNLHNTHCGRLSLLYLPASVQSAYFPSNLYLLSTFRPAFYGNANTNASESLQTSYDHYKCLTNNKNGLRLVTNILRTVINMFRICFPSEFWEHVPNNRDTSKSSTNVYKSLRMLGDHPVIIANLW